MATPEYPNYNPEHPTISGDFNKRYDRNGFGIGNIEANIGDKTRRATERTIQYAGQGTARVGKRLKEQALQREAGGQAGITTAAMKRAGDTLNKTSRVVNAASRGFSFKRSIVSKTAVAWAAGAASFFSILSYPMGIIALGALGAAGAISYIPFGETIIETVLWFTTGTKVDIWVLAMFCYILHFFLVICTFLTVYTILKFGGVKPLQGTASGAKNLTLIGSFIISLVPGANFIPWIWTWLFVVWLFPN